MDGWVGGWSVGWLIGILFCVLYYTLGYFILLLPIKDCFTFLLNLVVLCVLLVLTDHGGVGDGQKGEFLTKGGRSLRCEW
jgi:hypothetical protein